MNEESILKSVKKLIGIGEDDTSFDMDLIVHINTVFSILVQMGIGPSTGFSITGYTETWNSFIADSERALLEMVRTYIYLKVKMVFDPPVTGSTVEAYNAQIKELEWRLYSQTNF